MILYACVYTCCQDCNVEINQINILLSRLLLLLPSIPLSQPPFSLSFSLLPPPNLLSPPPPPPSLSFPLSTVFSSLLPLLYLSTSSIVLFPSSKLSASPRSSPSFSSTSSTSPRPVSSHQSRWQYLDRGLHSIEMRVCLNEIQEENIKILSLTTFS